MDMVAANRFADGIFAGSQGQDILPRERRIEEIARQVVSRHDIECLVVFADPSPSLYRLQFVSRDDVVACDKIIDFAHAGDTVNSAIFWSMRYYQRLPVNQLVRLASHLVVTAGELNSAMISGLEIVVCDGVGLQRWTETTNLELASKARQWDRSVRDLIVGP